LKTQTPPTMKPNKLHLLLLTGCFAFQFNCSKPADGPAITLTPTPIPPVVVKSDVDSWLTNGNQSALLEKQTAVLTFCTVANNYTNIEVDSTTRFQTIDGFGYTLTGGSATICGFRLWPSS
jgi:glucosylceramidase